MGTTISGFALWCYSYPRFVYKNLFKRSYWQYARETLGYIAVFILSAGLSYSAISQIHLGSAIIQIVANAGISVGITGAVIILALHRTGSFGYFVEVISDKTNKILKRS